MRRRCSWIIFSSLMLLHLHICGQSLMFSQYYAAPLNINPALAGTYQHDYFSVNYRSQWRDLNQPYQVGLFTYTHPVFTEKPRRQHTGNVAFSAFSENAGSYRLYQSWGVQAAAAYNLSLDYQQNYMLIFGLQGGMVQRSVDLSGLRWGSQYNPALGFDGSIMPSVGGQDQRTYPVFSTGFVWVYNPERQYLLRDFSAFAGLSVANLNRPDGSFTNGIREPLIFKVHGGVEYAFPSGLSILPGLLAVVTQRQNYHVNLGTYLHYKLRPETYAKTELILMAGSWYRWSDAFVFSGGLSVRNLTLATSIDLNQRKAGIPSMSGGAFEVTIAYKILRKPARKQLFTPMI